VRYYRYNEPRDPENGDFKAKTVTLSEQEILDYWDYWYTAMCKKYGRETVDREYTKRECIRDWMAVHWAWEVEDHQGER
jgi:hypothetical protein